MAAVDDAPQVDVQHPADVLETLLGKGGLSGVPTTTEARYRCSFSNSWTSRSHPIDFPENPTWESPALAAHTNIFTLWKEGELATKGVESFAKVRRFCSTPV